MASSLDILNAQVAKLEERLEAVETAAIPADAIGVPNTLIINEEGLVEEPGEEEGEEEEEYEEGEEAEPEPESGVGAKKRRRPLLQPITLAISEISGGAAIQGWGHEQAYWKEEVQPLLWVPQLVEGKMTGAGKANPPEKTVDDAAWVKVPLRLPWPIGNTEEATKEVPFEFLFTVLTGQGPDPEEHQFVRYDLQYRSWSESLITKSHSAENEGALALDRFSVDFQGPFVIFERELVKGAAPISTYFFLTVQSSNSLHPLSEKQLRRAYFRLLES